MLIFFRILIDMELNELENQRPISAQGCNLMRPLTANCLYITEKWWISNGNSILQRTMLSIKWTFITSGMKQPLVSFFISQTFFFLAKMKNTANFIGIWHSRKRCVGECFASAAALLTINMTQFSTYWRTNTNFFMQNVKNICQQFHRKVENLPIFEDNIFVFRFHQNICDAFFILFETKSSCNQYYYWIHRKIFK